MTYDSRPDTYKHIHVVQRYLIRAVNKILLRISSHDQTKLHSPEVELFDRVSHALTSLEYGSDGYKKSLGELGPALDHHYSHNSHHPEHYRDGIKGMNLIDLIEMVCDWMAATKRMANGDVYTSIKINQERFGYGDELKQILINTVSELE